MATAERVAEVERVVANVLAEVKRDAALAARISSGTNLLVDVGLDSLELTDLVLRVEDALGTTVDYARFDLGHLRSLRELAEFLAG